MGAIPQQVLTTSGPEDSKRYQAAKEWNEFAVSHAQDYDWEDTLLFPAEYEHYEVHSQEMADKLEEILGPRQEWLGLLTRDAPVEDLRTWLLAVCLRMSGSMDQRRVTTAKRLVEEAERFIREHYQESGLSLEKLCGHLHISQSYFSTIFKQETGRNYVQYLTEVRMEHAVELLRATDDKTYLIAEQVGYDEPNYFSYVFKKRFGVTPSQFRKQPT